MRKVFLILLLFLSFFSLSIACSDGADYVGGDGSGGYEASIPDGTNYIGTETGDLDGLDTGTYDNIGGGVTPPDIDTFAPINNDIQAAFGNGGTTDTTSTATDTTTDATTGGDTKSDKLKELEANGINIDDLKKVCESGKVDSFRQMFKSSGLDDVCDLF